MVEVGADLFDLLEHEGFLRRGQVVTHAVQTASRKRILDVAERASDLMANSLLERERGTLTHFASTSLTGAPHPCAGRSCRLAKVEQLARFACFYSDKVYIYNPFEKVIRGKGLHQIVRSAAEQVKEEFTTVLHILAKLRPLIRAGIVVPIALPCLCPACASELLVGSRGLFDGAIKSLEKEYLDRIAVTMEENDVGYALHVVGPEDYIEHRSIWFPDIDERYLSSVLERSREKRDFRNLIGHRLPRTLVAKLFVAGDFANAVVNNLVLELRASQSLGTSYLTERDMDIRVIASMKGDFDRQQLNTAVERTLTCGVPTLETPDYEKLVELREKEAESFVIFRTALAKAVNEQWKLKEQFREQDAAAIYFDILQPKLSALESRVKVARRAIFKGAVQVAVGWTAALTVGICAGILPEGIAEAAAALGLTKIVASLATELITRSDYEKDLKADDMYFLWKGTRSRRPLRQSFSRSAAKRRG